MMEETSDKMKNKMCEAIQMSSSLELRWIVEMRYGFGKLFNIVIFWNGARIDDFSSSQFLFNSKSSKKKHHRFQTIYQELIPDVHVQWHLSQNLNKWKFIWNKRKNILYKIETRKKNWSRYAEQLMFDCVRFWWIGNHATAF